MRKLPMPLNLTNLDERTRQFMLEELQHDLDSGGVYMSSRLSPRGRAEYVDLLRDAIQNGNDRTLALALRLGGRLNATELRQGRVVNVSNIAHETLAEGEYNRYYARGLCRRAIEDGITEVEVYRAKRVENPRSRSIAMLGKRLSAHALLADLRTSQGVEPALGLPPGPNSGISVRLPQKEEESRSA